MDIFVGFILMAIMFANPYGRVKACAAIFIIFGTHTLLANKYYLDSYYYYLSALIFDAVLVSLLGFIFYKNKPRYVKDVLWILFAMCILNIIGGVLYYYGDKGYIYAGAMFMINCALIIRLLIMTERDKDGAFSANNSYKHNSESLYVYKEQES